eukprot:PhM_4_TR12305/c0_g1_i1/m.55719
MQLFCTSAVLSFVPGTPFPSLHPNVEHCGDELLLVDKILSYVRLSPKDGSACAPTRSVADEMLYSTYIPQDVDLIRLAVIFVLKGFHFIQKAVVAPQHNKTQQMISRHVLVLIVAVIGLSVQFEAFGFIKPFQWTRHRNETASVVPVVASDAPTTRYTTTYTSPVPAVVDDDDDDSNPDSASASIKWKYTVPLNAMKINSYAQPYAIRIDSNLSRDLEHTCESTPCPYARPISVMAMDDPYRRTAPLPFTFYSHSLSLFNPLPACALVTTCT